MMRPLGSESDVIAECLRLIASAGQSDVGAMDIQTAVAEVSERHPESAIRIVGHERPIDGARRYQALMRSACLGGTIRIGFHPDDGLPWTVRLARKWTDRDLLRVNGSSLGVGEAIAVLDLLDSGGDPQRLRRLVDLCLIREALQKFPADDSDAALQVAIDEFRRQRGLNSIDDTMRWLQERHITYPQLEEHVLVQLRVARMREALVGSDVPAYFSANERRLAQATVFRIRVRRTAGSADTIERLARSAFYECMEQLAAALPELRGEIITISVEELGDEHAMGTVIGPRECNDEVEILKVLRLAPAMLDNATREVILTRLFRQWLDQQRATAEVEWFWGTQSQTG